MNKTITQDDLFQVQTKLELADRLLSYLYESNFIHSEPTRTFVYNYQNMADMIQAISDLLYQARVMTDCLAGDSTNVVQAFKLTSQKLISFLEDGQE